MSWFEIPATSDEKIWLREGWNHEIQPDLTRSLAPYIVESWCQRSRLSAWLHHDRVVHFYGSDPMGCYLRIDDEAVVVKLHKMFGSFGTTTCGVIEDGVYHADVPLKPDDVDFLDEVARRWSRAGESMLVIFNYDVDYILTLSKHPLDWLTKPDPPNENGRDRS